MAASYDEQTGEIVESGMAMDRAKQAVADGGLTKIGNQFTAALARMKPRNLAVIARALEAEAEIAGEYFYYQWVAAGKVIRGGSIGLASSFIREYGNCAVEASVSSESQSEWHLSGTFLDLEKVVSLTRMFRQTKIKYMGSGMEKEPERKQDILFQTGQSKIIRNLGMAIMPPWLKERCIAKAMEAVEKGINPAKIAEARDKCVGAFKSFGISRAELEALVGLEEETSEAKPMNAWNEKNIASLRGFFSSLKDGQISAEELKKSVAKKDDANTGGDITLDAVKKTETAPTPDAAAVQAAVNPRDGREPGHV